MKEDDLPGYYVFGPWPEEAVLRLSDDPDEPGWDKKSLKKWQVEARRRMAHSEKEYFEQLRVARSQGWNQ